MNEDMVAKFEQFDGQQLWVMLVCFGSPRRTVLYRYAFEALKRVDPGSADRWETRQQRRAVA